MGASRGSCSCCTTSANLPSTATTPRSTSVVLSASAVLFPRTCASPTQCTGRSNRFIERFIERGAAIVASAPGWIRTQSSSAIAAADPAEEPRFPPIVPAAVQAVHDRRM